jgi:paraquat-inducible protein B
MTTPPKGGAGLQPAPPITPPTPAPPSIANGNAAAAAHEAVHSRSVEPAIPTATMSPVRRIPALAWLIPIAALALAAVLAYQAISNRGPTIAITFDNGAGIQPDDPVTYRAVEVGRVRSVSLSPDLQHVIVHVQLTPDAASIATEGTMFWVVRPEVSLTRVSGLETLLGPRYIAVEPATPRGRPMRAFVGLDTQPRISQNSVPGLALTLRSQRLGSVSEGSPVSFREMKVGVVTSVELAADARTIDIQLRIDPHHAHLIRTNTKFWNASGIGLDLGLLGGVKLKAESLEAVIAGGIAFATPTKAGEPVASGHSFEMEPQPVDDWMKWAPDLTPPALSPTDTISTPAP